MNLQYPFNELLNNQYSIVLDKIPIINIATGFAWDSFLAAIIGAMIAGGIPAFIAFKAIKSNLETMRLQIELNKKKEMLQMVVELCAEYISIADIVLNEFVVVAKLRRQREDYNTDGFLKQFGDKQFDSGKKLNLCSFKIYVILNKDNEYSKDIKEIIESIRQIFLYATENCDSDEKLESSKQLFNVAWRQLVEATQNYQVRENEIL